MRVVGVEEGHAAQQRRAAPGIHAFAEDRVQVRAQRARGHRCAGRAAADVDHQARCVGTDEIRRVAFPVALRGGIGEHDAAAGVERHRRVRQMVDAVAHEATHVPHAVDGRPGGVHLSVQEIACEAGRRDQGCCSPAHVARQFLGPKTQIGHRRRESHQAPQRIEQQQPGDARGGGEQNPDRGASQVDAKLDRQHGKDQPDHTERPQPQHAEQRHGQRHEVEEQVLPGAGHRHEPVVDQGLQHAREDLDARHQAGDVGRGVGVNVAQSRRGGTDQHVAIAKHVRGHVAAQNIDVGDGPEPLGAMREHDHFLAAVQPGAESGSGGVRRGLDTASRIGPPVIQPGGVTQGQREVRKHAPRKALTELDAAHDTVLVDRHVGVADGGGDIRQARDGKHFLQVPFVQPPQRHRQHHAAGVAHAVREHRVVAGVVHVGFHEQHVQTDGARRLRGDAAQQLGMERAAPGPAADRREALLVDRDDDDVAGRRRCQRCACAVLQQLDGAWHGLRQAQHRDQREEAGRQQQP
jgi:hypothetical protein